MLQPMPLYNRLQHVTTAQYRDFTKWEILISLLDKHKLSPFLGIARLHRHFKIEQGQKVVWTFQNREAHSEVKKSSSCYPYILMFNNMQWQAVQFHQNTDNIWENIIKDKRYQLFFKQFKTLIEGSQLEVGIVLKLGPKNAKLIQKTDQKQRIQILTEDYAVYPCQITTQFYSNDYDTGCNGCVH